MGLQNRQTLKGYFSAGQRPTDENFKDLIESTVNILDDGFTKRNSSAIQVAPGADAREVISIMSEPGAVLPEWIVSLETTRDLKICGKTAENTTPAAILLKASGDIELQGKSIVTRGSTKGIIVKAPADGKWHTITEDLAGVNTLQVVAAYSDSKGKCNTIIAWASHCSGKRRKIKEIRPYTFLWINKLKLRWVRSKDANTNAITCNLQVRTRYNAGRDCFIKCSITTLWNHMDMD